MHAVKPSGRMAAGILASLIATSLTLGGCAVRPVPEQVTLKGYDTYAIVTGIRCETRQAIFNELLRILSEPDSRVSNEAVERIRSGGPEGVLEKESFDGVPQNTQEVLLPYANFAVVYDFKLDMSIQNNVNAALGIGDVFLARTFTGDISGKSNRKRTNIRQFRTSDTVEGLFREHMGKICERHLTRRKTSSTRVDYQYPITGSIGVDEIVHTFWRLNRDTYLKTDKGTSVGTLFADQIEFRTEIEASVTPALAATDPSTVIRLARVTAGLTNNRTDTHGVTIGIAAPELSKPVVLPSQGGTPNRVSKGRPQATESKLRRLASPSATANALKNANEAVDRLIIRQEGFRFLDRLDRLDDILE